MIITRRDALSASLISLAALSVGPALAVGPAASGPRIGAVAPDFTAVDSNGRKVSLSDLKGKTVVLEWTNDECPFVVKHYGGQAMQALQKRWTARDVVWLSVVSSAKGQQGYVDGAKANKLTADRGASPSAVLLDPAGDVGRLYRAQTTPHMYIVKPDGMLAYMGGIDDKPSSKIDDLKGAKNYVEAALTELAEGKPVSTASTKPYGCSVKFSS